MHGMFPTHIKHLYFILGKGEKLLFLCPLYLNEKRKRHFSFDLHSSLWGRDKKMFQSFPTPKLSVLNAQKIQTLPSNLVLKLSAILMVSFLSTALILFQGKRRGP